MIVMVTLNGAVFYSVTKRFFQVKAVLKGHIVKRRLCVNSFYAEASPHPYGGLIEQTGDRTFRRSEATPNAFLDTYRENQGHAA